MSLEFEKKLVSEPVPSEKPSEKPEEKPEEKPAPLYFAFVIIALVGILYFLGAPASFNEVILRPLLVLISLILFVTGIQKDGWRSTLSATSLVVSILLLLK